MAWFNREGMQTVWWRCSTAASIHDDPLPPTTTGLSRSFEMRSEPVQRTIIRNLTLARDAVGALAIQGMNRFARRVLRTCRGNLRDVDQGAVFDNFLQQHNVPEIQIEATLVEGMRVQPSDFDWLNQLVGSDYASYMPEAPMYRPQYANLSQHGVWEHGESPSAAVARASTDQEPVPTDQEAVPPTQDPTSQVENPTQEPTGRSSRAPNTFTPSTYDNDRRVRGRGTGVGRGGGRARGA